MTTIWITDPPPTWADWAQQGVSYVGTAMLLAFTFWVFRESIRHVDSQGVASRSATATLERMLCVLADIRRMLVMRTVRR